MNNIGFFMFKILGEIKYKCIIYTNIILIKVTIELH